MEAKAGVHMAQISPHDRATRPVRLPANGMGGNTPVRDRLAQLLLPATGGWVIGG